MTDPRFEVQNPEIEKLLRDIALTLKGAMPAGYGFSLFIFSYGEGGSLFYISSAERADMVSTLKDFLRKQGETSL